MALLGSDRQQLNYKQEEGTSQLRSFVESTIVSETPDIDRITRYVLYWHFYHGKHWRQYNETFLSFNYVRAFVDKVNEFLVGKNGFSHKVTRYDAQEVTEEVETAIEGFTDYHWNRSRRSRLIHELLQMGSVSGDAWIHLTFLKETHSVPISVLDSRHCFPEFLYGDTNKLDKFIIRQPLQKNERGFVVFVTEYTKDTIKTWFQKGTSVDSGKINLEQKDNPFNFIPIVHVKNKPTSDGYFAKSDVEDILKINKTYNEMTQEVKNIIDYYGTPTTVITGATAKTLRKGLGNIWSGLPPEANVFNLGLGEDLSGTMQFLTMLKTNMHELSDVPENSLGKIQAISNTSGAALQITYQPLIQQADKKWMMYGEGIEEVNQMIAKITRIMEPDNEQLAACPENFENDFVISPVFLYGLPQDRMSDLNQANLELSMKIASRREIMNRLSKRNVPALLEEIDKDLTKLSAISMSGMGQEPQNPDQNQQQESGSGVQNFGE